MPPCNTRCSLRGPLRVPSKAIYHSTRVTQLPGDKSSPTPEIPHQGLRDWQQGLPPGGDHPHRTRTVRFIPNSGFSILCFYWICISIHGSPPPDDGPDRNLPAKPWPHQTQTPAVSQCHQRTCNMQNSTGEASVCTSQACFQISELTKGPCLPTRPPSTQAPLLFFLEGRRSHGLPCNYIQGKDLG